MLSTCLHKSIYTCCFITILMQNTRLLFIAFHRLRKQASSFAHWPRLPLPQLSLSFSDPLTFLAHVLTLNLKNAFTSEPLNRRLASKLQYLPNGEIIALVFDLQLFLCDKLTKKIVCFQYIDGLAKRDLMKNLKLLN